MPKAFYQHTEVEKIKPRKPFNEAKKIYGKNLDDVPQKSESKPDVNTNFDELQAYRNQRSKRTRLGNRAFMIFLALAIAAVIWVVYSYLAL